jgi:hypothetical protein
VDVVAGFCSVATLALALMNRHLLVRLRKKRTSEVTVVLVRYFLVAAVGYGLATICLITAAATNSSYPLVLAGLIVVAITIARYWTRHVARQGARE